MPRAAGEGWRRVWNIRKNGGIEVRNLMEIVDNRRVRCAKADGNRGWKRLVEEQ